MRDGTLPADSVRVGARKGKSTGGYEVVADVAGGLVGGHAVHVVSDGDPLVEGYLQPQLTCL